jgi:ABC-2 type transport system permease protein
MTATMPVRLREAAAPVTGAVRAYLLLLRWRVLLLRPILPINVVVEALMAVGIVFGFAFLVPDIDKATALYLATGAPTTIMLLVGMVSVPQTVAQARIDGSYDAVRALPVPRLLLLAADATVWTLVALPGVVLAVVASSLRFDLGLGIGPAAIGACLLVALTATGVGYAVAALLRPMLAILVTQVIVFFVLLFSPVSFPADRLPGWLATLHQALPVVHLADLVRAAVAGPPHAVRATSLAVVAGWCLAGFAVTAAALNRRG